MASKEDLVGAKMPWPQADRLGFTNVAITCAGTTQATATPITSKCATLTTGASATGAALPNVPGDFGFVFNSTATTAVVYPNGASGTINNGSAGAGINLAQNKGMIWFCTASNVYYTVPNSP
jgi:hypothetical protein